jgi:hypothetical protein
MTYRPSPYRRRVYRALRCKPFSRIQRAPRRVNWLPSHETYRRMAAIGWYPDEYKFCFRPAR